MRNIRSTAYRTGRSLGDLNAITGGGISGRNVRSSAYRTGRVLGDFNAVRRGDIAGRLVRRGTGSLAGRGLQNVFGSTQPSVGGRVAQRVSGRLTGRGLARVNRGILGSGSGFRFDTSGARQHFDFKEDAFRTALESVMGDITNDLVRISSGIAPILKGDLRKSVEKEVEHIGDEVIGTVTYSVINSSPGYGDFNYAYWTHEMTYNLGPISAASAGVDGYTVGNKYLERPLKGEFPKYQKWVKERLQGATDK